VLRSLRRRGGRETARHAIHRLARWAGTDKIDILLLDRDIADSQTPDIDPAPGSRTAPAGPPSIAWLVFPPGAGSGGHTTLFRMIRSAQLAGFRNTLLLYQRFEGNFERDAAVIRSAWPWLDVDIVPAGDLITGFDACVASSWETGLPSLYFIQDFEPYFYPRGAMFALAEDSYRFGFRTIALGEMVRSCLADEAGVVAAATVPFGCDTEVYHLLPSTAPRRGVVFYVKRGNDRRGFSLAVRALQEFHRQHPDQPIHTYGDDFADAPFPVVSHGRLEPAELNALYNTVIAGLALSFTNISLVAEELLAAGVVPIVNDSPLARADLPNPWVAWAPATPHGLADGLSTAVRRDDVDGIARRIAASVEGRSWGPTGEQVVAAIRAEIGA
jgi:glycosyltransferase involved in cell wall biosynthesis